jgi:hypothetical protein
MGPVALIVELMFGTLGLVKRRWLRPKRVGDCISFHNQFLNARRALMPSIHPGDISLPSTAMVMTET